MNPHAPSWTNPRRLTKFVAAVEALLNREFADLSPADVHLCYNLLAQTLVAKFAVAAHEDKQRQQEKEISDAPRH